MAMATGLILHPERLEKKKMKCKRRERVGFEEIKEGGD
jgi:hypothetical protein